MNRKDSHIEVFKGLQKPLVFHSFKGKFIYWGEGFSYKKVQGRKNI